MSPGAPVWITRAQPGAASTAERVAALGLTPLVDPLLAVAPIDAPLDLVDVAALAFTSANGVEAFASLSSVRDLPVFTVGGATSGAAQRAGFTSVRSAGGDVAALQALIVGAKPGAVLWAGAREPAGDLVAGLLARGVVARGVAVYETLDRAPAQTTLARLSEGLAVLLYSPRAARNLANLVRGGAKSPGRMICLSAAVATALEGLVDPLRVAIAARPEESALLELLRA